MFSSHTLFRNSYYSNKVKLSSRIKFHKSIENPKLKRKLTSDYSFLDFRYYSDKPVLARVIRTGLQTSKGGLVAAILYPPPADFKFDQDSYKFIGILSVAALCGFIYTIVSKVCSGRG